MLELSLACEKTYLGICFVTPSSGSQASIFGFTEFISALALLVIVYTVTDIRYRFRVAVAPLPLFRLPFYLSEIMGLGPLRRGFGLEKRGPVRASLISQSVWKGILGFFFLSLVMTGMYSALITPPIFSEKNYQKFARELYRR